MTNSARYQHAIIASILCLLVIVGMSIAIDQLVSHLLTDNEQRITFRWQLLVMSMIGIGISTGLLFCYFLVYFRTPPPKHIALHPRSETHQANPEAHSITHILAVDDNPANLLLISHYLQHETIKIIPAANGAEAIDYFQRMTIHLIFMDIEMDNMNGIQATQKIRAIEHGQSRVPIIALSAHHEHSKKLHCLAAGFDDFIIKPVTEKQLYSAVQRWCNLTINAIENAKEEPTHTLNTLPTNLTETLTPPANAIEKSVSNKKIGRVIDIETSLKHSNQNPELAKDMLSLLIDMLKKEQPHLQPYYDKKNWEALYQLNHKFYGGSSYCGVPKLLKANQIVEKLLQQKLHFQSNADVSPQNTNTIISDENAHLDQDIQQALEQLQTAIEEIIAWDEQYDIDIVFDIDID
jgi:two-component system, NarL family, sensor histidine kinase BarA